MFRPPIHFLAKLAQNSKLWCQYMLVSVILKTYLLREFYHITTDGGKVSEATIKNYKEIHLMILLIELFTLKNDGNENFLMRKMQKSFSNIKLSLVYCNDLKWASKNINITSTVGAWHKSPNALHSTFLSLLLTSFHNINLHVSKSALWWASFKKKYNFYFCFSPFVIWSDYFCQAFSFWYFLCTV